MAFLAVGAAQQLLIEGSKSLPQPYVLFTLRSADFPFNPLRQAKQDPRKLLKGF
jgi:hypothetical protein